MAVNKELDDQTTAGTGRDGSAGRLLGALQSRFLAATGRGARETGTPSWRANNEAVAALNIRIMAATAERVSLLGRGNQETTAAARAQALADLRAMQDSMARDELNLDVEPGAHTDADVEALRQRLEGLDEANGQLRSAVPPVTDRDVAQLRADLVAAAEENIELLGTEIYGTTEAAYTAGENPLVRVRESAVAKLRALRAPTQYKEPGADAQALQDKLGQLQDTNSQLRLSQAQRGAAELEPEGFVSESVALFTARKHASGPARESGDNPAWLLNNEEARRVNGRLRAKLDVTVGLLNGDIASMTGASDRAHREVLGVVRDDVARIRESVIESIAQDKATKGQYAYGWRAEELDAQKHVEKDLDQLNHELAIGRYIRDLESRNPDQTQAANAARHVTPATEAAPKSIARAVVMNPRHAAGLHDLEGHQGDSIERGDGALGR